MNEITNAVDIAKSGMASGTSFLAGVSTNMSLKYLLIAGLILGFGFMITLIWWAYHNLKSIEERRKKGEKIDRLVDAWNQRKNFFYRYEGNEDMEHQRKRRRAFQKSFHSNPVGRL